MAQTTQYRLGTEPDTRKTGAPPRTADTAGTESPTLMLLVMLATIGVIAYAIFLLNPANRGDMLPWIMVMVAETVLVIQAVLSMWTVLASGHEPRNFAFHSAQENLYDFDEIRESNLYREPHKWPMRLNGRPATVDVYITTYGEDLETIRETALAALALQGEHLTYILDDGKSDEVRALAEELGVRYVRRMGNNGAKAGNINYALSITGGKFFVIFDADFVPKPNFLYETVPFFANEDVAFVQTPQAYGNLNNLISRGAGYMQAVFYRFIQPGRNRFNAAFSVGTNVIFRRTAIEDIGGMYSDSKSEDVWTSLKLHENGWRSIYIPTELAVGDTPETIEAYTKQQLRWATGGFEIMLTHNPLSLKHRLTLDQRVQYLVTATHYLTGIAPLLLILVPPMQIFLNIAPMNTQVSLGTWIIFYLGFYLMQIAVAFYTLGSFRLETLMLAAVSFPIYTRALMNAIFKREQKWHVTGGQKKAASPFNFMIPQVLFFVFLVLTSIVGLWKDMSYGTFSLALAWNTTNAIILGAFIVVAFREARRLKRPAQPAPASDASDSSIDITGGNA
jgi:cellulose synthase (UDP-forming)